MKNNTNGNNYTTIQLRIPLDLEKKVNISDPVYSFNAVMEHIDLRKYYAEKESVMGCPRYDSEKLDFSQGLVVILEKMIRMNYLPDLCRFFTVLSKIRKSQNYTLYTEKLHKICDVFNCFRRGPGALRTAPDLFGFC